MATTPGSEASIIFGKGISKAFRSASGMLLPAITSNQPSPRDSWSLAWIKPPSNPMVSGGPGGGSASQSR